MGILSGKVQIKMIKNKSEWIKSPQNPITRQGQTDRGSHPSQSLRNTQPVPLRHKSNIPYTLARQVPPDQTRGYDEREKITIVPFADTIVKPDAMVITVFDATVADSAVG